MTPRPGRCYPAFPFSAPRIDRLSEPTVIDGVKWPADEVLPGMPVALIKQRNVNYERRARDKWGLIEWVAHTCKRFAVHTLVIEAAANGISAAQELGNRHGREGWSIVTIPARGDKVSRALSVQPIVAQKMVLVPDRSWAEMFLDEVCVFPKSRFRDVTDSMTMGLNYLRSIGLAESDVEVAAWQTEAAKPRQKLRALYPV
jgi:predicted phage terminase large subunit-like protein